MGTYAPRGASKADPETVVNIDTDKAVKWLQSGAQPTERVAKLFEKTGVSAAFQAAKDAK